IGRAPEASVDVVNLLGDAVAARGDIQSMVSLSLSVRQLLADAAAELAAAAKQAVAQHDVVRDIEHELASTRHKLSSLPDTTSEEREALEGHMRELERSRAQWQSALVGGGLEAGVF